MRALVVTLLIFAMIGASHAVSWGWCGDGIVDPDEECDAGTSNGLSSSCCFTNCTLRSCSHACRPSAGDCDVAEYCTGVTGLCPNDVLLAPGVVCGLGEGPCLVDAVCNGWDPVCPSTVAPDGSSCDTDEDLCTIESCNGGNCVLERTLNYDDGAFCNGVETCDPATGFMVEGTSPACDDGDSCTVDTCNHVYNMCVHFPMEGTYGPCGTEEDDYAICEYGEWQCEGSSLVPNITCVGAVYPTADEICGNSIDDNCNGLVDEGCNASSTPCTSDADCAGFEHSQCQAAICDFRYDYCAVVNLAEYTPCDDGLACTTNDMCDEAMCVGTPVVCDDGNECTKDSCTEPNGICVYDPEPMFQRACNLEDNLCSINDSCDNQGNCIEGNYLKCPVFAPCQAATCNPTTGLCDNSTLSGSCDDGNPCTEYDSCGAGECHGSEWSPSPSPPYCFNSYCDPDTGVTRVELMSGYCFIEGSCRSWGDLKPGAYCAYCFPEISTNEWSFPGPQSGGSYLGCGDTTICTENDQCRSDLGTCQGTWIDCSVYQDQCNEPGCSNEAGGCFFSPLPNGTPCSGNACYVNECYNGGCWPYDPVDCSYLITDAQCQYTDCDEVEGCFVLNYTDGTPCNIDYDICSTGNPTCVQGVCTPGEIPVCSNVTEQCGTYQCWDPDVGCVFVPFPDGASCDDSSLCTENDQCISGSCTGDPVECGDGYACTIDYCFPESGCVHASLPNCTNCAIAEDCGESTCYSVECVLGTCIYTELPEGEPCPDSTVCNGDETCDGAGYCRPGTPRVCDDENDCTTDTCDPVLGCQFTNNNSNTCSDGLFCTTGDHCVDGACQYVPVDTCDLLTTQCTTYYCFEDVSNYTCTPFNNEGYACDDDDPCTENDQCDAYGGCVGTPRVPPTPPNECIQEYVCNSATGDFDPVYAPAFTPCTQPDKCFKYECSPDEPGLCHEIGAADTLAGYPLVYYPNGTWLCLPFGDCRNPDFCNPSTGTCTITYMDDGTPCEDGDACTTNDQCIEGYCQGLDPVVCYPLDQCHQAGECIPDNGTCTNPPKNDYTPCDDANVCTPTDVCIAGVCNGVDTLDCSTGTPCLEPQCDPETGCYSTYNDGVFCDDGNDCTLNTTCLSGACPSGTGIPLVCPSEPCQQSDCLSNGGCTYSPLVNCSVCETAVDCPNRPCKAAACEDFVCTYTVDDSNIIDCVDSQFCNGLEFCNLGTCHAGTPPSCDDSNECTLDECNYGVGACTHDPNVGMPCTNTDLCATYSECSVGATCVAVTSTVCDPAPPCWVSMGCEPETGTCIYHKQFDNTPCNDNNACTTLDICLNGTCVGEGPVVCIPSDACHTSGPCDTETGLCPESPRSDGTPCDDGLFCTSSSECQGGVCEGTSNTCDGYPIADEQCQYVECSEAGDQCVVYNVSDGTYCDTGNPTGVCSDQDICLGGVCTDRYTTGATCRASTGECDQAESCIANDYCPSNTYTPDGTSCETNTYCWSKVCSAGSCVNDEPRDCSTDIVCQVGACDEEEATCYTVNAPDYTSCTESPDQCVAFEECIAGSCEPSYALSSTLCDDGNACTTGDHCDGAGGCVGGSNVDCSSYDTLCRRGWCNSTGQCEVIPAHDGIQCDADGLACTVNDTCVSGVCIAGPLRDCSYLNTPCAVGVCVESGEDDGTCEANVTSSECNPDHCTGGCTYTIAYWADHNSRSTNPSKRIAWPSNMEHSTLCGKTWLQHAEMRPKAMAWRKLAQAYISARLNVESGACLPPSLAYILYNASTLLLECNTEISLVDPSSGPYKDLTVTLDGYNGGIYGPGNCETESCANLTSVDNDDPCLVTPPSYYRASHVIVQEEDGETNTATSRSKKTKEISFRTSPIERDVCPPPDNDHDDTGYIVAISILSPIIFISLVVNVWLIASRRRRRKRPSSKNA